MKSMASRVGRPLVRLLAINDVYKLDSIPRLATLLEDGEDGAKRLGDDTTTVRCVAGDFLSPNILSPIDKGRSFLKAFNRLGFTHACFGNHEADLKEKELQLRCGDCESSRHSCFRKRRRGRGRRRTPLARIVMLPTHPDSRDDSSRGVDQLQRADLSRAWRRWQARKNGSSDLRRRFYAVWWIEGRADRVAQRREEYLRE